MWKVTQKLREEIYRYAKLPQTGVSLRQMVQFGPRPSQGTLFHASYFAVHELPIRLSHRVRELEQLPDGLAEEPSIQLVRDWYAHSFQELVNLKEPILSDELKTMILADIKGENDLTSFDGPQWNDSFHVESVHKPGSAEKKSRWEFEDDGIVISRNQKPHDNGIEVEDMPPISAGSEGGINNSQSESADRMSSWSKPLGLTTYFHHCPKEYLYPNEVVEYNKVATSILSKIKRRHDATVTTLARGVQSWKQKNKHKSLDSSINQFLDGFYMSRIGIRMLIGQTIALNLQAQKNMQDDDYVGIISLNCNIKEIAEDAIDAARFACEEHFNIMDVPKVKLYCAPDLTFRYVPGHLVHMLYETLKNSLRATIEHHSRLHPGIPLEDIDYPPIKIIVAKGDEDITIKISDEGGGIPRSAVSLVWTYFYTSAEKQVDDVSVIDTAHSPAKAPFMGLGVGLPHSRLYARYFHGDLKLISMEGYGTDVYLHLNRLSSSSEPLH